MNKFLNLVENNLPPQDLDKNREVLRELQQLFNKAGITSSLKTFKDIVTITIGDKVIDLELKHISQSTEEEEGEDEIITGVLNTDPARLKNNPQVLKARTDVSNAIVKGLGKVAKNITTAANRPVTPNY
jgi:hypothetical protein